MARKVLRRSSAASASAANKSATGSLRSVYSSFSPIEAHIVSGMLEASGIECFISNEYISIVDNPISRVTGGVMVQVRDSDVPRAIELLKDHS
jgi:hypothetical protein